MARSGNRTSRRSPAATTIARAAAIALLCAVLAVAAAAVVVPRVAGAIPLTVLSNSMAPTMPTGSLAVVRPTMDGLGGPAQVLDREEIDAVNDVDGIGIGDVIVFAPESDRPYLVIHRVTGISIGSDGRRTFTTRGDNNSATDDPVAEHQVRAVLWYHLPLLGHVNDKVGSGARLPLVIGAATLGYAWAAVLFVRAFRRRPASGRHAAPDRAAGASGGAGAGVPRTRRSSSVTTRGEPPRPGGPALSRRSRPSG